MAGMACAEPGPSGRRRVRERRLHVPFLEYPMQQAAMDAVAEEVTTRAAAGGTNITAQVQWDAPHAVDLVVVWTDGLPPAQSVALVSDLIRKVGGNLLRWEHAAVWPKGGYPWKPAVLLLPWLASIAKAASAAVAPSQTETLGSRCW